MSVDQFIILFTSIPAIAITQFAPPKWQRWACLIAVWGQPFWVLSSIRAHQYGMVIVNSLYSLLWLGAIFRFWIQPWRRAHGR